MVNYYSDESLVYAFSGLDTTVAYQWDLQVLNSNGMVLQTLFTVKSTGSATAALSFGNIASDGRVWPVGLTAPLRVVDNFGQVLGYHFIAPAPDSDWTTGVGINDADHKTVIGSTYQLPVDSILNNHHQILDPSTVTTRQGEYSLLHYRADAVNPSQDIIEISNMADATSLCDVAISELSDYNQGPLASGQNPLTRYVVIETAGILRSWLPIGQIATASFASCNPMWQYVPAGSYDYRRSDEIIPGQSAIGESVWLVSQGPASSPGPGIDLHRDAWLEWTTQSRSVDVVVSGQNTITLTARTEGIWDAWLDQELDSVALDTSDWDSQRIRQFRIAVSATPEAQKMVIWQLIPSSLNYLDIGSAGQYGFQQRDAYRIFVGAGTQSLETGVDSLRAGLGIDNDEGTLLLFLAMATLAFGFLFFLRAPGIIYAVALITIGGGFLLIGWFSPLISLLVGMILLFMVFLILRGSGNGGEQNA